MARQRPLARAPIVEAIFDVRVSLGPSSAPATLHAVAERVRDRYPQMEERRAFRTYFEMHAGAAPRSGTEDLGFEGVVLKAPDGLSLVQFRRDGFTFNRLRPYTSWDDLLPEVERLWCIYAEGTRPEIVSRVAVRFINRLSLPLPINDFGRYLTAPPGVPEGERRAVSAFLSRVTLIDSEHDHAAHILQALEPGAGEAAVSVILDIDAFAARERGFSLEAIIPTLHQLRQLKNGIFFGSITETTAEMYE